MRSVEVLITGEESTIGTATVNAAAKGAASIGMDVHITHQYRGGYDWLCLYGAGEAKRQDAFQRQIVAGRHAALWDLGYFGGGKNEAKSYVRVSVDNQHPHALLERTVPEPSRWQAHGIALREDANPDGHVVVAGMGPKSKQQFNLYDWEQKALHAAKARFPDRRIVYRPKRDQVRIDWPDQDATSPIEDVLRGASLVITRHSNCAIDACIAGVPCETEDGAAKWLYDRGQNQSADDRLDFLRRLSWFNWKLSEMSECWRFLTKD